MEAITVKSLETWIAIPGFEGIYEASDLGNIRSLKFYGKCNYGKVLRPRKTQKGYCRVNLGASNDHYIHRIIAILFVPNPYGYTQVNHKDCNKENNQASNLEWCSASQNMRHAYKNGRILFSPETRKKISLGRIAYWKALSQLTK